MSKIEFSMQRTMDEDLEVADFLTNIDKILFNIK